MHDSVGHLYHRLGSSLGFFSRDCDGFDLLFGLFDSCFFYNNGFDLLFLLYFLDVLSDLLHHRFFLLLFDDSLYRVLFMCNRSGRLLGLGDLLFNNLFYFMSNWF